MGHYFADSFISYNNRDADQANNLREFLRTRGVNAYIYQNDLLPANEIKANVRDAIERCDAFVPLISPNSVNSSWVARELGLASRLHRRRGQQYPIVVPVYMPGSGPIPIWLRDFETGLPNGRRYDLGKYRGISLDNTRADSLELIVRLLKPEITYYGEARGDIDEAPAELWELYERLFPNRAERDPPHKIKHWINEVATLGDGAPWRELFATITVAGRVVGFAWLSAHRETGYIFGNYFCMDLWWREFGRAEYLLDELEQYTLRQCQNAKGILFEVEPFDARVVDSLLRRIEKRHKFKRWRRLTLNAAEQQTVRSLRRLALYLDHPKKRSKTLVNIGDGPMRYRQPAMSYPFDATKEVELILMMRPLSRRAEEAEYSAREVVGFLYDHLFGDAYEEENAAGIAGYRPYLQRLKEEVLATNAERLRLQYILGDNEKKLLLRLKRESIVIPL
jgi:hypothetical protein